MNISNYNFKNYHYNFKGLDKNIKVNVNMDDKLIDQHLHGAFGVNFNNCSEEDVLYVAKNIKQAGVDGIFPTLATDSPENIKRQIAVIKRAAQNKDIDLAKIYGVHLEGIFLNPEKAGIHDKKLFLAPTIENYKTVEDDFIKIVTLAPELDKNYELSKYLLSKGVKVQAGHCLGGNLDSCTGATHLFNAMSGINHRGESTALSALNNDNIYTEIIGDGIHLSNDALKLIYKAKPIDKIILISDCLPIAGIPDKEGKSFEFAGKKIYYRDNKAVSENGTLAGSALLLSEVVDHLKSEGLYNPKMVENTYKYHNLDIN